MEPGTEWTYVNELMTYLYSDDRYAEVVDSDTFRHEYRVWVHGDTILRDTMQVTIFKFRMDSGIYTDAGYYFQDGDGFKNYAYSGASTGIFTKKGSLPLPFFGSFKALSGPPPGEYDRIIYQDPPTLNVLLPLNEDSYWTFRQAEESTNLQIDKEVVGTKVLSVGGISMPCYQVNWHYICKPWPDDISVTEWISEAGLVRREIIHGPGTLTMPDGSVKEYVRSRNTVYLKEFKY